MAVSLKNLLIPRNTEGGLLNLCTTTVLQSFLQYLCDCCLTNQMWTGCPVSHTVSCHCGLGEVSEPCRTSVTHCQMRILALSDLMDVKVVFKVVRNLVIVLQ